MQSIQVPTDEPQAMFVPYNKKESTGKKSSLCEQTCRKINYLSLGMSDLLKNFNKIARFPHEFNKLTHVYCCFEGLKNIPVMIYLFILRFSETTL